MRSERFQEWRDKVHSNTQVHAGANFYLVISTKPGHQPEGAVEFRDDINHMIADPLHVPVELLCFPAKEGKNQGENSPFWYTFKIHPVKMAISPPFSSFCRNQIEIDT